MSPIKLVKILKRYKTPCSETENDQSRMFERLSITNEPNEIIHINILKLHNRFWCFDE